MNTKELIQNFYKLLTNIRNQKQGVSIETAFIHWYVDTRFEKVERGFERKITDGPDDGGIDAVIFGRGSVFVIQSEFCRDIFEGKKASPLSPKKYAQFDGLPEIFKNDHDFKKFLDTVDKSLHSTYRRIAEKLRENPSKVIWEITTLHSRSSAGEGRLRNIDSANIKYGFDNLKLYELSLEGATPPAASLELNFTENFIVDDSEHKIRSHVFQAFLRDFINYMKSDQEFRVLARNVRSELKDRVAQEVKNGLVKTYQQSPWEFWYSHNGITIVCDKALIKEGKKIFLTAPYIINGAQTIHALKWLQKTNPEGKVLVRVIEIPTEGQNIKKFINSIIFRTNLQNRMYTYDLRANDIIQVKLDKHFLNHKVFYERRRGDWDSDQRNNKNQGLTRLKSTLLAQILTSCKQELGGVPLAKTKTEELFSDKYYMDVFDAQFPEIFFKYRLFIFIRESLNLFSSKSIKSRDRNHVRLPCLAIAWSCLEGHIKLGEWLRVVDGTPNKFSHENRLSKDLRNDIQNLFKETWGKWKAAHKKDDTLDPHDFFKTQKWIRPLLEKLTPKFQRRISQSMGKMLA